MNQNIKKFDLRRIKDLMSLRSSTWKVTQTITVKTKPSFVNGKEVGEESAPFHGVVNGELL